MRLKFIENIILDFKIKNPYVILFILSIIHLFFSIAITDFSIIYRYDPFYYLIKAIEITDGNWVPDKTSFMGWPIVEALFLKLFWVQDIDVAILFTRILSSLIMALTIIPLYKI